MLLMPFSTLNQAWSRRFKIVTTSFMTLIIALFLYEESGTNEDGEDYSTHMLRMEYNVDGNVREYRMHNTIDGIVSDIPSL